MQSLDLSGTWLVRYDDGQRGRTHFAQRDTADVRRYLHAQVPGEIHLDLMRLGIVEDVCSGLGALRARWVEESRWAYRREFSAPAEALAAQEAGGRVWLAFDGLDLHASIILNGQTVGNHANAFYPCRVDITGHLRPGRNVLAVEIESGLYATANQADKGGIYFQGHPLVRRHWLRKPQMQAGWDFTARLSNVGITGPVRLEWSADAVRLDQLVPLVEVSDDLSSATVRVRQFVEGLSSQPVSLELTAEVEGASARQQATVTIEPGLQRHELVLKVENPRLWWPIGHGAQPLYTVRLTAAIAGRLVAQRSARIGFRRVRILHESCPRSGMSMNVQINNKRIFVKGGNWVPADMIVCRSAGERLRQSLKLALEANFNFLRINGCGQYEPDEFYDLCDELGILVWQDFPFSATKLPIQDEAFYLDLKRELIWNIRRLAGRASLIAWCGNNEGEWDSWEANRFAESGQRFSDYALFHLVIPRLLADDDPQRYYQPSSPYSPPDAEGRPQHPNRPDMGSQHTWTISFGDADFRKYRLETARFPIEGGLLGSTSLHTMRVCLGDHAGPATPPVHSFLWDAHENSVTVNSEPGFADEQISQWVGKDPWSMSLEAFTYWAGLVHGEGLREYCENFRRRMFDTGAAVFWQFNDSWPATRSWAIVDYHLRRTPAFWAVRRALAALNVVVAHEGDQVIVYGVNDADTPVSAELRYGVMNLAGGFPIDHRLAVTLPPNTSTPVARFAIADWPAPDRSLAFALLSKSGAGSPLARARLQLPLFKDMHWPAAQVHVRVESGRAVFQSDTFAWGVCLDLDGQMALADNFFDVWPGIPHAMDWPHPQPPEILFTGNLVQASKGAPGEAMLT